VAKNKTSSKEVQRQRAEARRLRRASALERRQQHEAREAALRAALARPAASSAPATAAAARRAPRYPVRVQQLVDLVRERAPRLLTHDSLRAFQVMAKLDWIRPAADWQPGGNRADRLFCSLAEHLFARYPVSRVVWTAFFDTAPGSRQLARVVVHVAAGGSLFQAVRSGLMPVPLTRKMCHEILSHPGEETFLAAIRKAQVRTAGGSVRFCRAWIRTLPGRQLQDRAREEFWHGVMAWLARNGVAHAEVGPLVDYIAHRRAEDGGFTMKGRTLPALQRGMGEWHRVLARRASVPQLTFRRSGLLPLDIERNVRDAAGRSVRERWHFREILDTTALADEGQAMRHCVYSYARQIESRQCSIWTLTLSDGSGHWRRLTIEVQSASRRIVQARGPSNRLPEPRDMVPLREWAARNNLALSGGL
jgi:hypothetical protein